MHKKIAPQERGPINTFNVQYPTDKNNVLTPIKSIRAYCLDCCCGSWVEVKQCPSSKCVLFPYRLGKRPRKDFEQTTIGETPGNPKHCNQSIR